MLQYIAKETERQEVGQGEMLVGHRTAIERPLKKTAAIERQQNNIIAFPEAE